MVNKYLNYSIIAIFISFVLSTSLISYPKLSSAQSSSGINWMDICTKLQSAFYQPCSSYVNPDNTLTYDGEVALKCIKTGGLLGGGAAALGLPTGIITRGLNILAGPTGCGNIVNPDELNKIGDLGSITNLIP
jgi:hypothetical protein